MVRSIKLPLGRPKGKKGAARAEAQRQKVWDKIREELDGDCVCPSQKSLAKHFSLNLGSIHRIMKQLSRQGLLVYTFGDGFSFP